MAEIITCPLCQKQQPDSNKFCNKCGNPIYANPSSGQVLPSGGQHTVPLPQSATPTIATSFSQTNPSLSGQEKESVPFSKIIAIGLVLVVFLLLGASGAYYYFFSTNSENIVLRLHGSNTLGSKLIPALAKEFLRQQGAKDVEIVPAGKDNEVYVRGILPGDRSAKSIEVHAHGTKTGFQDLLDNKCDIGMASRKINTDEIKMLTAMGDLTSQTAENVVGLDGIAIIVNRANTISTLTRDDVKKIFTGRVTSWADIGGQGGHI